MKTLKFKTNIKCGNCIATVKPFLENVSEIEKWEVDLESNDRILSVTTEILSPEEVKNIVLKAGFIAIPLEN